MSIQLPNPSERLRSRLVGAHKGQKLWAFQCGGNACDSLPVFESRLVGTHKGLKLFGFASECRDQPFAIPGEINPSPVNFVLKNRWPPFGISDVLKFKFFLSQFPLTAACFGSPPNSCPSTYLLFDGVDSWTGKFIVAGGELDVQVKLSTDVDPDNPGRFKWYTIFSNCQSTVPPGIWTHLTCSYPLKISGQSGSLSSYCCPVQDSPPDPAIAWDVEAFTERALPARLIGTHKGLKLFATSRCCPPDAACEVSNCCGCPASPFQYSLSVGGVVNGPGPPFAGTNCPDANGDWVLSLVSIDSLTGECEWASPPGPHGPVSGMWHLRCLGAPTNAFQLITDNTGSGGGQATYQLATSSWDCLGSNTLSLISAPPVCTGWPSTLTVNPI